MNNNYIEHHGILGQKWGVRRYQNADGTLTDAGKRRYNKQYETHMRRLKSHIDAQDKSMRIAAYNRMADQMNNGLIEKYNADYDKKLGSKAKNHDYGNDKEYNDGYQRLSKEVMDEAYAQILYSEINRNRNFRKAQELVKKYGGKNLNDTNFDIHVDTANTLSTLDKTRKRRKRTGQY